MAFLMLLYKKHDSSFYFQLALCCDPQWSVSISPTALLLPRPTIRHISEGVMPPEERGIVCMAAWTNIEVCVCVCGFQGVVFPSTFILCLLFWSLVMWLKSINHQSNSRGSLTHELRGRNRGGKCQESFQWTLSISCSDWERKAGSLPTEVLAFWGLCRSCLISVGSLVSPGITSH